MPKVLISDALSQRAAEILAAAKNPGILAGSRVLEANAVAELVEVAEALGTITRSSARSAA